MALPNATNDKKRFYCREWAFQKLSHCLDQRPISKACGALILGGPGSGKTTFCSELVWPTQGPSARQQRALNRRLLGYHFLAGQNEQSLLLSEFLRNIVGQILSYSTEGLKQKSIRRREKLIKCTSFDSSPKVDASEDETVEENAITGRRLLRRSLSGENSAGASQAADTLPPALPISVRTLVADAYYEKLLSDEEIQHALKPDAIERNPDDCLKRALLFPLLEIDPPKQCLFFIIDSIDEVAFSPDANSTLTKRTSRDNSSSRSKNSRTIAELLSNHHHLFPQWLLLVCTARKQSKSIAKMFTGFRKLSLDDLRKSQVVRDVQQYILARLDQEMSLRQHISRDTAEMLNQLHIKSNGCFLYLAKVLDGISESFIILREIKEIPGTLNGLYLWLCQRLFNRKQFAKVKPLLNVLLAARAPLTRAMLHDAVRTEHLHMSAEDFQKRFHLTQRVLNVSKAGGFLSFFHHSFAEWLLDIKHCTQKYLCNIYEGHTMLAMFYLINGPNLTRADIHLLAFHLTKVEYALSQRSPFNTLADKKPAQSETKIINTIDNAKVDAVDARDKSALELVAKNVEEVHFLALMWLITCGARVETCLLEHTTDECDFTAYEFNPPRDPKVIKLLTAAGARLQEDADESAEDAPPRCCSQISGATSVSEPSAVDPFFELISGNSVSLCQQDANGRTLLHCLAAEGNATLLGLALQASQESVDLEVAESSHGQTALNVAASHGHAPVVEILLAAGAHVDHADADGWTALRAAAWGGHLDVVNILLKHGCQVDSVDADHRTALRAAAWSGHDDIVRALIEHDADVNKTDLEGRTALIAAAYMGHAQIVECLLDSDADIDHEDMDGRTALSVAALCVPSNQGYAKVVSVLLERGAKVDHEDKDGMTPLLVAAFEGHKDVCELLLEYEADIEHADKTGRTPLWAAACMGHANVVGLLLFWGCCVDTIEPAGRTVLSMAAAQGCIDVVRLLLDRGLDEQHRDNAGWTPLHYAAFEGHKFVCEALLEAGARIDEIDNEGKCPLMLAAQEGHLELVDLFLDVYKADVNQHSHDGKTALRLAALEGHFDVVRKLLQCGCDVNLKDADGRSTLYVLALDNRLPMARYLIEHGAADVETRDLEGRTPLHVSCWQGHYDMVALLLNTGAGDVNAVDLEQRSALHSASWQGHADIVRLLLENGAVPDHACNQGATALGISGQQGHEECVLALLEYGADPTVSDGCGRNALRVAHKSGHLGVVRLLQEYASNKQTRATNPTPVANSPPLNHMNGPVGNSGSNTSVTSGSTAETKPSCAVLYPPDWVRASTEPSGVNSLTDARRSCVSLGQNSSNSKSSSNLTGSSHSSRHANDDALSFTQQLQQCTRVSKNRPLSKLLSPLQSEPQSPIYASPPLTPRDDDQTSHFSKLKFFPYKSNVCSPGASVADTHFARDTHMRIILGSNGSGTNGGGSGAHSGIPVPINGNAKKVARSFQNVAGNSNNKAKRNGIVTNPALRLMAGVKNGLDSAAANLRGKPNPALKTNSFQWRKETPL